MADNKKYYKSEMIEFQNGDKTNARQLTIKRLRLLTELFGDHEKENVARQDRVTAALAAAKKKDPKADENTIIQKISEEIEAEGGESYLDVLVRATVIALDSWGVTDNKEKNVQIDKDYIEDNLDYPSMVRIAEIAGSMELGNLEEAGSGKAKD